MTVFSREQNRPNAKKTTTMQNYPGIFELIEDRYDGVTIAAFSCTEAEDFAVALGALLETLENKKLLWIKLAIEHAALIPVLTGRGFVFHHCGESELMLLKRLVDEPEVPTAKNHTLGVGAVVMDGDRLLVVKDRIGQRYKLPGGYIDDSESISNALVREVQEETGIDVVFDAIVSLGHFMPGQFNESNLYVVCRAKPLSTTIGIIDDREIVEARWMEIDAFLNHEEVVPYNKKIVRNALESEGMKRDDTKALISRKNINYELFC